MEEKLIEKEKFKDSTRYVENVCRKGKNTRNSEW
jgi:hypothetical protein